MAISPPGWCRGAIPTLQGWRDPNTNELLKSQGISQEQIDEYLGVPTVAEVKKEVLIEAMPEPIEEEEEEEEEEYWTPEDLDDMTKLELEELGREYGIELDRRHNKQQLIEELKEAMFD